MRTTVFILFIIMFVSLKYSKFIYDENSFVYLVEDSNFKGEARLYNAASSAATNFILKTTGKFSLSSAQLVAVVTSFYVYKKSLIAKNIAVLLLNEKNFNPEYFPVFLIYLNSYFSHPATKHLNIEYKSYHDDIVKEYRKLSSMK